MTYDSFVENVALVTTPQEADALIDEVCSTILSSCKNEIDDNDDDNDDVLPDSIRKSIGNFFPYEGDPLEEVVSIPLLDTLIITYGEHLSLYSINAILRIFFASIIDSYTVVGFIVTQSIRKKNVEVQHAIGTQFIKSMEYYDAGHRLYDDTLQDQLIDTFFEQFECEPLVFILKNTSQDTIQLDGMEHLFVVAFTLCGKEESPVLLELKDIFTQYVNYLVGLGPSTIPYELLTKIKPVVTESFFQSFTSIVEVGVMRAKRIEILSGGDVGAIESLFGQLGSGISYEDYSTLQSYFLWRLKKFFSRKESELLLRFCVVAYKTIPNPYLSNHQIVFHGLIKNDYEYAKSLFKELYTKDSNEEVKRFFENNFEYILTTTVQDEARFSFSHEALSPLVRLIAEVTEKSEEEIFVTTLKNVILRYNPLERTEEENNNIRNALTQYSQKIDYSTETSFSPWHFYVSAEPFKIFETFLPFLVFSHEQIEDFYINFFGKSLEAGDKDVVEKLLPRIGKRNHEGMYSVSPKVSHDFATIVGQVSALP